MKYALAGKTGAAKGIIWPVESKVVIGRDAVCDISLNDSTVSRRHCCLSLEGDDVALEDLGSSNATLINGRPKKRILLRPGDEISVGSSLFVFCRCASVSKGAGYDGFEPPTSRVRIGESARVSSDPDSGVQGTPRTIEDLAELFSVGRELSRASSIDGLITILLQRLSERFNPGQLWICRSMDNCDEFQTFPSSVSESLREESGIQKHMQDAIKRQKPVLVAHLEKKDGPTSMVAPIAVAHEVKGVIVVQSDARQPRYEDHDIELLMAIANAAAPYFTVVERVEQLERENTRLISGGAAFTPIIGSSRAIQHVRTLARNSARSNLSILITGETGTGKELLARMIHEISPLSSKPLVTVNCAAIPEELFESELFGHERGAFTGAHARKIGLLEEVNGGTLFLDEVGDLSLQNQARLLRAIETRTFRRVGGTTDITVEFRIISATNKGLQEEIQRNTFRRDFFHRLAGMEIQLPPLRERRSDIPELAQFFLDASRDRHRHQAEAFEPEALQELERRDWPGNIRELRNIVERAAVLTPHRLVRSDDLNFSPGSAGDSFLRLVDVEKKHIGEVLRRAQGNVQEAATMLGIGRSTLYRKIEEYELESVTLR